ncbi:MAG: dual specificity protein phosphatase [Polyangiaceae bacterium]
MWRVDERLWLGDYQSGCEALAGAQRPDGGGQHKPFFGVVSLCPVPLFPTDHVSGPTEPETEWLKVPILDGGNGEAEFEQALSVALPFIARRRQQGNVLVHCAAGMSRSVSVIAAVLCGDHGLSSEQAFDWVADAKAASLGPFVDREYLIYPAQEFRALLGRRFPSQS